MQKPSLQFATLGLIVTGALVLFGAAATASPVRTASGSYRGIAWQARSVIVATGSTATLAGGGNPAYFASMPQYSGVVALVMTYGGVLYVCSGTLLPDRRSIVTAAHCVSDGEGARPDATTAYFYGGPDPDTVVPFTTLGTPVAVSDYFVNTGYSGDVIDHNDIAVLRLVDEAPAFAASYDLYDGGPDGTLTGKEVNLTGYGRRSSTGGAVGDNLDAGRLRQGDNRYAFRFGDADFSGFWDGAFGLGSNEEFSYVADFDSDLAANDASCILAGEFGLGGGKYCNLGRGFMESTIAGGDSGGPDFIGGRIASVNSYSLSFGSHYGDIDDLVNSTYGEFGGYVPVYRHLDFIRSHLVSPQLSLLASMDLKSPMTAGCKTVTGTVTLSRPAPAGGVVVALSDTLASASLPATLTVLAGATTKAFMVKTVPVRANEVGTVSATVGSTTLSQPLVVRPMGPSSLALTPISVVGGQPVTGKVTLECKAGPGPITVVLSSNNSVVASPVATSIVVPQSLQSAYFAVTTNAVQAKSYATISGAANGITKSKKLTVNVAAAVTPISLKFGSVAVGMTSGALNASLTNTGTTPFSVGSISLTGSYALWFSQSNNCSASLAPGASCSISVKFRPFSAASKAAKLSISTSATSTPLSVSLSGTGI